MSTRTLIFNMAPRNPNVNGIYYDEYSYSNALKDFFKHNQPVFDKYDNDTEYYKSNSHCIIGTIIDYEINDECDLIEIELDEQLRFITPEDYVIGFKLSTNGTVYDENLNEKRYVIDKIIYATLIHKEFLQI